MYEDSIKRIVKSSSILLSGNLLSSLIGLVVVSILTKKLTLEQYGTIVMVQAYAMLIGQVFSFQTWQALIKYCTDAIKIHDRSMLIGYLQTGFTLDIAGAILSCFAAFGLVFPITYVLNLDGKLISSHMIYMLVNITNIIGMPTAILRLSNSYKYFNYCSVLNWSLKLTLITLLAIVDKLSIGNVLFAYLASEATANLLLFYFGIRKLANYQINPSKIIPCKKTIVFAKKNVRYLIFILRSSANGTVLGATRILDELIIGALIGPAAAGIFKVIKITSSLISKMSDPLYLTFYPEIAKFVTNNDTNSIKKIIKKFHLYIGCMGLIVMILFQFSGEYLIQLFFTKEYLVGFPVMSLYLLGLLIPIFFFYLQPLMLAYELDDVALIINSTGSVIYLVMLYFLVSRYGLYGIAFSFVMFWIFITGAKIYFVRKKLTQL